MRTTPFKNVYDAVLRLHGLNPRTMRDEDVASSIVMHINSRVEQIVLAWNWPEWDITEERAFRQLWANDRQYYKANSNGLPDEVFYIPTMQYYTVNPDAVIDPPVGTLPTDATTNPTYFLQLTQVEPYIEYDQPYQRPIGQVLGVYSVDPRTVGCCRGPWMLKYHPTEKGINVCGSGPTVFVLYQMPIPTYSMQMHIPGSGTHQPGDVVLDETTNECFQAITATVDSPSVLPSAWTRVPFLQKWFDFVRWGAFADSLSEISQGNEFDPNVKIQTAAKAESNAMDSLQANIDSLVMQGQKIKWDFGKHRYWCESIPWNGGAVTTLGKLPIPSGFIPPAPIPDPDITEEYHPEIQGIMVGTPSLVSFATITRKVGTLFKIIIIPAAPSTSTVPEYQMWRLESGSAQVGNPSEANPLDYNPSTNNKHWRQVL